MTPAETIGILIYAFVLASALLGLCAWTVTDASRAHKACKVTRVMETGPEEEEEVDEPEEPEEPE